jgi:hypothetical protein
MATPRFNQAYNTHGNAWVSYPSYNAPQTWETMYPPENLMTTNVIIRDLWLFMNLTIGQILTWRALGYGSMGRKWTMSHYDMLCLMDTAPPNSMFEYRQQQEALFTELCTKPFSVSNLFFIKYDSSALCRQDVTVHATQLCAQIREANPEATLIFVSCPVSIAESEHKLHWEQDEFGRAATIQGRCQSFINVANNLQEIKRLGFDQMFQFSMVRTNEILCELELQALQSGRMNRFRNEVNDDAQLRMLLELRGSFPGSRLIMVTSDAGLQQKCRNTDVIVEHVDETQADIDAETKIKAKKDKIKNKVKDKVKTTKSKTKSKIKSKARA